MLVTENKTYLHLAPQRHDIHKQLQVSLGIPCTDLSRETFDTTPTTSQPELSKIAILLDPGIVIFPLRREWGKPKLPHKAVFISYHLTSNK